MAGLRCSFIVTSTRDAGGSRRVICTSDSTVARLKSCPASNDGCDFYGPRFSASGRAVAYANGSKSDMPRNVHLCAASAPARISVRVGGDNCNSERNTTFNIVFSRTITGVAIGNSADTAFGTNILNRAKDLRSNIVSSKAERDNALPVLTTTNRGGAIHFCLADAAAS